MKATYAYCGSPPKDPNPLDRPPRFQWQSANETVPTDVAEDPQHLCILNSAGFPFDPSPTGDYPYRVLTVTRYEPSYQVGLANTYEGSFNSDAVNIPLAGSVEPGQMLCKTYEPMSDFDVNTPFLRCRYTFWVRKGNVKDADGNWDAFKHRILDQGYIGWFSSGGQTQSGAFAHAGTNQPATQPVLLDGTGQPVNASDWVILDQNGTPQTPVAAPNALSANLLETSTAPTPQGVSNVVFLKYYKHGPAPFSALNLFM